ncbi:MULTISPECIES: helix-turn-helix domain-containing protein [Rhodococcus]|uniref:hypothetical protein n=1 Tax=Rhodococcus TaxID=1827 RepID=UPI00211A865F|nr:MULTISPECIES: hypothetical protein [Rhodococcus]MEA1798729.1 hypothetical protein [Rhodococcus qingshengii]
MRITTTASAMQKTSVPCVRVELADGDDGEDCIHKFSAKVRRSWRTVDIDPGLHGKILAMRTGFGAWIRGQIDARGYESTEEAARALGVYPSLLRHWATIVRSPSPQVLRQVAVLFDAPIQEVLIAAGYMTEEENRPLSPTRMSLQQMSNKQILDEIRRRTAGDTGGTPIPVRVNGVLHTPDG